MKLHADCATTVVVGCRRRLRLALPEMRSLPSAKPFAESKISGTRQRPLLPSVVLGKEKHSANKSLPRAKHSATTNTRQRVAMPRARLSAKKGARQRVAVRHRQLTAVSFAECTPQGTRQRTNLPSAGKRHSTKRGLCRVSALTLGKHILFFSYFCNQTFCIVIIR
jgi:hypothetical protein